MPRGQDPSLLEVRHHLLDPRGIELTTERARRAPQDLPLRHADLLVDRRRHLERVKEHVLQLLGHPLAESLRPVELVLDEAVRDRVPRDRVQLVNQLPEARGLFGHELPVGGEDEPHPLDEEIARLAVEQLDGVRERVVERALVAEVPPNGVPHSPREDDVRDRRRDDPHDRHDVPHDALAEHEVTDLLADVLALDVGDLADELLARVAFASPSSSWSDVPKASA